CQPRAESARASASPRPREAPVMIALAMRPRYEPSGPTCQRELVLRPGIDEARANREHRRLRPVRDTELGEHTTDVRLHRLLRAPELRRDLLVREPTPEKHEPLSFPRRQAVERIRLAVRRECVDEPRRDDRVDEGAAVVCDTHRASDLLRRRVL